MLVKTDADLEKACLGNRIEDLARMPRSAGMIKSIQSELKIFLGYDYQVGETNLELFTMDDTSIKKKLGQITTPEWTADLMTEMSNIVPGRSILDPCFGDGAFLTSVHKKIKTANSKKNTKITGIELDPVLFARGAVNCIKTSKNIIKTNLYNGSIFDLKPKKFDVVIMNPPYIRQEELFGSGIDKKTIISKISESIGKVPVSSRSNLYSYFIVYLTQFLNHSGIMSAIIPKVWLDSEYGCSLQKFLLDNYDIQYILDFGDDTFSSAMVEDCILIVKKNNTNKKKLTTLFAHIKKKTDVVTIVKKLNNLNGFEDDVVKIVPVDRTTLLRDAKWGKFLHIPPKIISALACKKMVPLSQIADVVRGTTTLWNKFFVTSDLNSSRLSINSRFYVPIINSPKDLRGFNTSIEPNISHMLLLNEAVKDTDSVESVKRHIHLVSKNHKLPLAIEKLRKENPDLWYTAIKEKSGPIIFNYVIRKAKNFILNEKRYNVRDNFYIITPKSEIDKMLLFGILNSSLTKLSLETTGRRYGNGVLKIQAYELKNMGIPDPKLMDCAVRDEIKHAAEKLSHCSFDDSVVKEIIAEIDKCVHQFLNIGLHCSDVMLMEKMLAENRLQRSRQDLQGDGK